MKTVSICVVTRLFHSDELVTLLLTWSDRGAGPVAHHRPRSDTDRGPVLRLLEQPESQDRYDQLWVLTTAVALPGARALVASAAPLVGRAEIRLVDIADPSDHAALFAGLTPWLGSIRGDVDVLLSAGTPQAQTLWVILVQAGLLRARMIQVIPPAFVPVPHPRPIREVRLDIDGFPEIRALRAEVHRLRAEVQSDVGSGMVGRSAPMQVLRDRLRRVAPTVVSVLIEGETGTGKELIARGIHRRSDRAEGPFVVANCGAFAEGVLASELFGHEVGAFTGAGRRHRGLFEQADGGTLFLDEIGEMPRSVQVHLLRVLEEGRIRRLGAEQTVAVDVRIVAATHRDLAGAIAAGTFRQDLFYRLRGATLTAPPLRDRVSDLEALIVAFLDQAGSALSVSPEAMRALRQWSWPGNVRELRAEVHRWIVFADDVVWPADLAPEIQGTTAPPLLAAAPPTGTLAEVVARSEAQAIVAALAASAGNLSAAARALQIDRNTLKRKMTKYGIPRDP